MDKDIPSSLFVWIHDASIISQHNKHIKQDTIHTFISYPKTTQHEYETMEQQLTMLNC